MDFNPSAKGFNFNEKIISSSDGLLTILANKSNEDSKFVVQCVKIEIRKDVIEDYIKQVKSVNSEYIYSNYLKYFPKYKTFISVTPFIEKSLDNIKPLNYFDGIESRNKLFLSLIEVLRSFDNRDLIHGDLKLSNILLTNEGKCLVTDFYKYQLLKKKFPRIYLADRIYYSPEMINSKELTIKSDIWSLGCIIYYCCSGKSPFCASTVEEADENINNAKYKPLTDEYEIYNHILSKIFVIDVNKRISVSDLLAVIMNNNNLPVPADEDEGEKNNEGEKVNIPSEETISLPSSEQIALPSSKEKKTTEIYTLEDQDIDILTSEDFDRIWIELVYSQSCNNKERIMKYLNYIKAVKEQGSALDKFMDKLINYIEYFSLLWDVCKDFINDYYKRSSSSCKVNILPIYKYPFLLNNMKSEKSSVKCCKIIGNRILVIEKVKINGFGEGLYKKVEKIEDIPNENKKRIVFSEEIEDMHDETSDPVKLFSIFFSKHLTPERMKTVKVPLQYPQQYVTYSKFINIYPIQSGLYTSISITPNLPKGLKLNKTTGRIHGFHRIKNLFNGSFTVTAFINNEEVNRCSFTLAIKKKNFILIEKKYAFHPFLYLKYKHNHYSFKVGEDIKEIKPKYICDNPSFSFISEVPPGLKINEKTGIITGNLSQYFNSYYLIINMTNGYESTSKEILIRCDTNGKKDVKEWTVPVVENSKRKHRIFEVNEPISIPIPNVDSAKDKKNLIFEPNLPKDIIEYNYHNCVIAGVSSKPLPKTHYIVKNKETNKTIYEFDLEVKSLFNFSYSEDKYSFKIGDNVNINPIITVDKKEDDTFTYSVGYNRKLPNGLKLDSYSGLICGVPTEYVWEDEYDISVKSNLGVKTVKLTLFTGEKPKIFKYKDKVFRCFVGHFVGNLAIFEGRCCEFRVVEGEFPNGFTLNRWNGLISGITYNPGEYKLKVRCENSLGYIEEDVIIEVNKTQPSTIEYEKELYELVINKPIDPIVPKISNNGDYCFKIYTNNLPACLNIDSKIGVISGAPTEICKSDKTAIMKDAKGEEKEYGNKVGRNVVVMYKERNSHYTPISLYFHVGNPPQLCKYGDKNECTLFRSRYFIICPPFDDCECNFNVVNGDLPNGIVMNNSNGSIYGITYDEVKSIDVTVRCENSFGLVDIKLKLHIRIIIYLLFTIDEYFVKGFKYNDKCYYLCKNEEIEPIKPLDIPSDGECDIQKSKLPSGLSINKCGIITGKPTIECDECDYLIYWNGIYTVSTPLKISIGIKPTFELKYENNGMCKCGFERKLRYCLLNDEKEIKNGKGCFSIEPDLPIGIRLNQQTGEISGEGQSEDDDSHYKVTFENHFGKVSTEIDIISRTAPSSISYPHPYYSFDLNKPICITSLKYGGNDLKFSINPPLPKGLSIGIDNGVIEGKTPSKPYYQKHKVIASNDYGKSKTEILLYFGNADYFVYYDEIEYYGSKSDNISIKPRICGKKSLPDGLTITDNCEIVGVTKSKMKLAKYTIIEKNENEYNQNLLLEIGDKPNPIEYEKNDLEVKTNTKFSFKPKEKYNIGCKFTVEPQFPEGVEIHIVNGKIYGKTSNTLTKTNYTIICSNKYGSVKTNISLTIVE